MKQNTARRWLVIVEERQFVVTASPARASEVARFMATMDARELPPVADMKE